MGPEEEEGEDKGEGGGGVGRNTGMDCREVVEVSASVSQAPLLSSPSS